jgi:hypothetical protein
MPGPRPARAERPHDGPKELSYRLSDLKEQIFRFHVLAGVGE